MNLVIVESPTKAKTISKFLGKDFVVKSSYGHLRDLPKGSLGVDVENDFKPTYVIPKTSKKTADELKTIAKQSDIIYFASDEDREGEAIAWHLSEILKAPKKKTKRISFHEITKDAILASLEHPRDIDLARVDAQQARRILDRLVGYKLSPFLWRKVAKGLSAGRVQSVALRLIVEREREIQAFKRQEYWTVEAVWKTDDGKEFATKLTTFDGKALEKFDIKDGAEAERIVEIAKKTRFSISDIKKKEMRRLPQAPFTTSTLQQDANRILGFSAKQTMKLAQDLYEGVEIGNEGQVGLITYMRTDSVNLSEKFLADARTVIMEKFGASFVPSAPRIHKTKAKLAQEAHEAIRPTEAGRDPESMKQYMDEDRWKLYSLIWKRAVASQMPDAVLDTTSVDVANAEKTIVFRASGSTLKFQGFLLLYPMTTKENLLPALSVGQAVTTEDIKPLQHFTEPPGRYNDATIVKALEQYGIGRPSTYAPTISTIIERNYVARLEGRQLSPTELGILVNDILVEHFPNIVDFQFTANMENNLDNIATGEKEWVPVIREFYTPFAEHLATKEKEVKKETANETTDEVCKNCGKPMAVKMSRYGKFLACTGFPECRYTKRIPKPGETESADGGAPAEERKCAKCGAVMEEKMGRFGAYFKCASCGATESKKVSLGVKCPACNEGDMLERKTGRGRVFYSCSRYPDCKFALWNKPTGEKCPQCSSLLVFAAGGKVKCSSKECKYKTEALGTRP